MSNVVCLMNVEADRATFTWSEGPASFEPYTLDGMVYKDFQEIADEARGKLADLVKDYLFDEQAMPKSAFALAAAGHELYEAMFQPGADQARQAKQVRKWLEQLAGQHEVDTLEVVVESPWSLPWNVIYDQPPDKEAFLSGDENPDRWKPFWGLRYNLAGGRKVDPLRRMPLLNDPKVLMVVDPEIRDGLPEEQQKRLADFTESHKFKLVHSKDELQDAVKGERPDLLYWLSHASADALVLAGEEISPRNMRKLLRQDDDENFGGLAFLNACQTAEGGESGSFFEAFHNVGFAGMIGTEHQTVDQFANPLGLDFLEAFLDRGEPVGSALRKLRGRVPLGLLYGMYCPPDIRVDRGDGRDGLDISQVHVQGVALSAPLAADETATRTLPPLPREPYRSLAYYDREDRALFAGRDPDIERFATYLDDASTRILVLHGESGVGKSSFLHAGVIPYLEEECLGYRFIRDWEEEASAGAQGSVIFIRATNDLFGQLAQALCEFCARPYEFQTPLGEQVSADLPGVLGEFIGDDVNQGIVRAVLRSDASLLGRIMAAISDRLPFSAILVIDQGEEIFTLAQTPEDQQRGRQALDMLRRTVGASGDFKVIFCLRTEYYGRVIDRLRRGLHDTGSIREYLLTDFDEDDLLDAVRRPTLDVPIPYTSDVPFERYGFRYADGVAEEIAQRVIRYTTQRRDSVLPLMQVICAQLYRLALQRADKTITLADLEQLGGIGGGMRNHVEGLLGELLKGRPLDKKPLQSLFTQLYLKQPDGTLTTALLAEDEVQKRWTGRMPFGELLRSSRDMRLLKVNSLRIGMEEERRYVSLGHDALAKIAADWDEQLSRGARVRKMAVAIGAISAVALVMFALAVWGWTAKNLADRAQRERVEAQADSLLNASPGAVPLLLKDLAQDYDQILPRLTDMAEQSELTKKQRVRIQLALLHREKDLDPLRDYMLAADPDEFRLVRESLEPFAATLADRLWADAADEGQESAHRFRAACVLAKYDPDDDRWDQIADQVAQQLVRENVLLLKGWMEALRPVKARLVVELGRIHRDSDSMGEVAAAILADFAADQPELLGALLEDSNESQFPIIFEVLKTHGKDAIGRLQSTMDREADPNADDGTKERLARQQANAAVCLLKMGSDESVWPRLREGPDPRLRSMLIHLFRPLGVGPKTLVTQLLRNDQETSTRRALIESLGDYEKNELMPSDRDAVVNQVTKWYEEDPDAGIHGACRWLLQRWNPDQTVAAIDAQLAMNEQELDDRNVLDKRQWYVNHQLQTMVIVPGPIEFVMGSPCSEAGRHGGPDGERELQHTRRIARSFAIGSTEVTVEQFLRFSQDHKYDADRSKHNETPINAVNWFQVSLYCNWLSKQEGIPEAEWCYLSEHELKPNCLELTGYRLPTEAEWEYACRAGTSTSRHFGETETLLGQYACHMQNSQFSTVRAASLKPNGWGLFDMYGNVYEWSLSHLKDYPTAPATRPFDDRLNVFKVGPQDRLVLRGGSFTYPPQTARSAGRDFAEPYIGYYGMGFRVARTLPRKGT